VVNLFKLTLIVLNHPTTISALCHVTPLGKEVKIAEGGRAVMSHIMVQIRNANVGAPEIETGFNVVYAA